MSNFLEASGWTVLPAGEHAIRAISPMTLGLDGQHAAFFIAYPDDATFYLTDACETSMHASSYGIELAPKRIDILNETPGVSLAHFDKSGADVYKRQPGRRDDQHRQPRRRRRPALRQL